MNYVRIVFFIYLLMFFDTAHAEVMDKEPLLTQNIAWGMVNSCLCFFIARFKPRLLLFTVPVPVYYFLTLISEIHDPFVGPAILNEAGKLYIYSSYGLGGLVLVSIFGGLWWRASV